jgi:hypothetical protein
MPNVSRILSIVLPLAFACALGSSIAHAEAPDADRLAEAWKDAIGDQEPILSSSQFAKLNNLAFQAAVPKICDGYDLDLTKFSEAMADATAPTNESMTGDEQKQWEAAVLVRFGVSYGLFLAEGNNKPEHFCANAKALKEDSTTPNYWH